MSTPSDFPDHIGWDLTQAARLWAQAFQREMAARGYPWFLEARGRLIQAIPKGGTTQGKIALRLGMTKQAVQQQVDLLVKDGILTLAPDPRDRRRKQVIYTDKGLAMLKAGDAVKAQVEARMAQQMGTGELEALRRALQSFIASRQ